MTTDLDVLTRLRPDDVVPDDDFLQRERNQLLATWGAVTPDSRGARRRSARRGGEGGRPRRARWIVVPVAVLVVGASAVYAATRGSVSDPTRVTCRFDAGTTSVIDAVSGDPVADCTALWDRTHSSPVPALRAYRVGGAVVVLRADADPPPGAETLPVDAAPDRAVVAAAELDARLHDYGTGLYSEPCIPYADAVARVEADVVALGLAGSWTVRADPPPATDACGLGFLDPETSTVVVRGVDRTQWTRERGVPAEEALRSLGRAVVDAVEAECVAAATAAERARRTATAQGYPAAEVRTVVDGDAGCSRVTVTAAGAVHLVVHGPRQVARADG